MYKNAYAPTDEALHAVRSTATQSSPRSIIDIQFALGTGKSSSAKALARRAVADELLPRREAAGPRWTTSTLWLSQPALAAALTLTTACFSVPLTITPPTVPSVVETVRGSSNSRRSHYEDMASINRIHELAARDNGWAGEGSVRPAKAAADDAERFIRLLATSDRITPPVINAANDGEINFYWNQPTGTLDLGFYGNGTYSYYGTTADGSEFAADAVAIGTPLPRPLIEAFKA